MAPTLDELRDRGDQLVRELDAWRCVNDDLRSAVVAIADAASAVAEATVAGVSVAALTDPRAIGFVSDATEANSRAMRRLSELTDIVVGISDEVSGRLRVLGAAVDALRADV